MPSKSMLDQNRLFWKPWVGEVILYVVRGLAIWVSDNFTRWCCHILCPMHSGEMLRLAVLTVFIPHELELWEKRRGMWGWE
jgi:hypothetical protein